MPIKRLVCLLVALSLLLMPVRAQEQTLEQRMEEFRQTYGLHSGNFSLCYYNTVTGEEYRYNDSAMMVAASTYKLPLNMYYYELEAAGELAPDAYIPRAGTTLDRCHEMSLQHSDNETSMGLLYNLGNFRTYKDCMRKYFSVTDEELDPKYYMDNYYSTAMMMDALQYLYDNQQLFSQLLDYLKLAREGEYFKRYITDVPVAHKYGSFEGAENDVGIIWAEQPFLLAVYTQGAGEIVCGKAALLLKEYVEEQAAKAKAEEEARKAQEEAARKQAEEEAKKAQEEAEAARKQLEAGLAQKQKEKTQTLIIAGSATGLCLLALLILLHIKHRKRSKV